MSSGFERRTALPSSHQPHGTQIGKPSAVHPSHVHVLVLRGGEPRAQAGRRGPCQPVVGQVQVGEGGEGGQERRQLARQLVVGEVQVPAPTKGKCDAGP